jgi:hypothetical protein
MENEDKKQSISFLLPEKAREYFLTGSTQELEFKLNQKILSQIYDALFNLYEIKKTDNYFPDENELYNELEFRKKSISDKIPLPEKKEIIRLSFILATHKPSFLSILKELRYDEANKFYFVTKFALPFNNDINFLQKGISQVLHNSLVTFRNHYTEINPTNRLKEKIVNFKSIDDLKDTLETGQVYVILKKIYFYKTDFDNLNEKDIFRINLINQRLKELLLKPLTYQLVKDKLIVSIKRNFDNILPDILLINNLYHIEVRFNLLLDLIYHPIIKNIIYDKMDSDKKILIESKNRIEQALEISQFVLTKKEFPEEFILLASEIISLYQYIEASKQQEKIELQKIELKQLIDKLSKSPGIFRIKSKNKVYLSPELMEYILKGKIPQILFATIPIYNPQYTSVDDYEEIYLLLKEKKQIASAIEQAKDLYQKVRDIHFIRILEQMLQFHDKTEEELNQLIPSYIKEDFYDLVSQSYIQNLPLLKRILYKITNERINKKTLIQFWKDYCKNNQLNINKSVTLKSKEKKNKSKEIQEIDLKQSDLFIQLKEKIEWYLERDIIPTEKILYHDFKEQKKELDHLFKMINVGLKSVQDITTLTTSNDTYIISKPFLIKHKEELLNKFKNKLQELEGIETKGGKLISLKTDKDKIELYKKIIKILNEL